MSNKSEGYDLRFNTLFGRNANDLQLTRLQFMGKIRDHLSDIKKTLTDMNFSEEEFRKLCVQGELLTQIHLDTKGRKGPTMTVEGIFADLNLASFIINRVLTRAAGQVRYRLKEVTPTEHVMLLSFQDNVVAKYWIKYICRYYKFPSQTVSLETRQYDAHFKGRKISFRMGDDSCHVRSHYAVENTFQGKVTVQDGKVIKFESEDCPDIKFEPALEVVRS